MVIGICLPCTPPPSLAQYINSCIFVYIDTMKMLPVMKQHGPFKDSDERREFEVRISTFVVKFISIQIHMPLSERLSFQ